MTGNYCVGVMPAFGDIIKPVTPARFADPLLRLHDDITQRGKCHHIPTDPSRPSASSPFTRDKAAGLTLCQHAAHGAFFEF